MPWIKTTRGTTNIGQNGVVAAIAPQAGLTPVSLANQKQLNLPSGVSIIKEAMFASLYEGSEYFVGGLSQNLMMSRQFVMAVQGIRPLANEVVSVAGTGTRIGVRNVGSGLTGTVKIAVAPYDSRTDEVAPLSMLSPEFTLTNGNILVDNLPTSVPQDDNYISGTTTASATASIVGGGNFLSEVRVGDLMALTSAPSTFGRVLVVTDDTHVTLDTALGNGTTQGIIIRRSNRIDSLRIYMILDNGLPRVAAQRQLGVTSIQLTVTGLSDLGEAFTEDFTQFPRCKYGVMWEDRQAMAGDINDPAAIWLSLVGLPERRSTIALRTPNRQPVTSIYVVNEMLIVTTADKSFRVSGYTADDIVIKECQQEVGCVSMAGVVNVAGFVFVPTHLGVYLTDGSSWWPMNLEYKRMWTDDLAARPFVYQSAHAYVDPVRKVYAIYLGQCPYGVPSRNAYLVHDYTTVIPIEGGTMGQPRLSWDIQGRVDECAAQLRVPGLNRTDAYTGSCDGQIFKRSLYGQVNDSDDAFAKRIYVVDGADDFGDPGGNVDHGKNFTNLDLYAALEECEATVDLYAGDEFAFATYQQGFSDGSSIGSPSQRSRWQKTFGNSQMEVESSGDPETGHYEVKTVWNFEGLDAVSGRRMTLAITAASPADSLRYYGRSFLWKDGETQRSVSWSEGHE